MAGKIDWSFNVVVAGGPKFSASRSIQVDAYDKVDALVPKKGEGGAGAATVGVQPGGEGKVQFLLITSSVYDDKLTFKVDGGSEVKLDEPQLLVGDGAVRLLNQTQKEFVFKNDIDPPADASVQILAGRKS
ncbi:MAG TPA: hypothetical protein VGX48_08195 [Pyrinomonadaceae bacterium]|jgi:hypothetical protein|nr:hypothetical protein [Pyrinomonadaceae bacterium]